MNHWLSRAGDRRNLEYFPAPAAVFKNWLHILEINGGVLWKLTHAQRFTSPWNHASNVHGSQFSDEGDEQIAVPMEALVS
jgi:hypothetical protein